MNEEKYICRCWNDNPPIDCGGCSCVKIHDKWIKDYFLENEMCDYYDSIIVDEELERKIHEEAERWREVEEELPPTRDSDYQVLCRNEDGICVALWISTGSPLSVSEFLDSWDTVEWKPIND